jgi:DNA-binding CsgD family transcriptional regulator
MAAPLTPTERHARDEIVGLAERNDASPEMLEELSVRLNRLVPFDGALWTGLDPGTTLATAPARVENLGGPEECRPFWDREFLVSDYIHFSDLARAAQPAASLRQATDDRPARSPRFREFADPTGFDDELRAVLRVGGSSWGLLGLYRGKGKPHFSANEVALVAELSAPLGDAFRRAALIRQEPGVGGPNAPGLMMFDERGTLESLNDEAAAWLAELPEGPESVTDHSVMIPMEILGVVARARAIAAGLENGIARLRVQSRRGRWLVIHASCLRDATGNSGKTALVIEPAQSSEIAPLIVAAYQLTAREIEITQAIARGLATGEIAQALFLSVHTVRDYVKTIFEKTSVSSRGELVAKVFAEHYLAPLHAETAAI